MFVLLCLVLTCAQTVLPCAHADIACCPQGVGVEPGVVAAGEVAQVRTARCQRQRSWTQNWTHMWTKQPSNPTSVHFSASIEIVSLYFKNNHVSKMNCIFCCIFSNFLFIFFLYFFFTGVFGFLYIILYKKVMKESNFVALKQCKLFISERFKYLFGTSWIIPSKLLGHNTARPTDFVWTL